MKHDVESVLKFNTGDFNGKTNWYFWNKYKHYGKNVFSRFQKKNVFLSSRRGSSALFGSRLAAHVPKSALTGHAFGHIAKLLSEHIV